MLIRYGTNEKGKRIKVASLYTPEEHKIDKRQLDRDALKIMRRLNNAGFDAYLVGGAVRDLLIGKIPKDFDIATDAQPQQIKRLFRNSRIIGRRFQLVHIFFGPKIIEVSTFRSNEVGGANNNIFGTIEDDVKRRDFTLNALYYSPNDEYVLDYVDGYKHIQERKMESLIPLDKTFIDDPVRLIRAVKYAENSGFSMPFWLKRAVRKYAQEISRCPSSRLTEEVFKILQCGNSRGVFDALLKYGILAHMLPGMNAAMTGKEGQPLRDRWLASLALLDDAVNASQDETPRSTMLAYAMEPFLSPGDAVRVSEFLFLETFKAMKEKFAPITPPNKDVEGAVRELFTLWGLHAPRTRKKKRRRTSRSRSGASEKRNPEHGQRPDPENQTA